MADVADFVKALSEGLLDRYTREQLSRILDHYRIEVGGRTAPPAV